MSHGLSDPHALWAEMPSESDWPNTHLGSSADVARESWELLAVALLRLEWIYALDVNVSGAGWPVNTRDWPEGWKRWAGTLNNVSAQRDTDAVTLRLEFARGTSGDAVDLLQRSLVGDAVLRLAGVADLLCHNTTLGRSAVKGALAAAGGSLQAIGSPDVRSAAVIFAMRDGYMHGEATGIGSPDALKALRYSAPFLALTLPDWFSAAVGLWRALAAELRSRV